MTPAAIDRFCRSLRAATRIVQWEGVIVFKVGGKMFAMLPQTGDGRGRELWFKADDVYYDTMKTAPGFRPCPYLARARWVAIANPARLPPEQLKAYLRRAHAVIAGRLPRKAQLALGFDPPPRPARRRRAYFDAEA
ncbi:MAG: MmcQ/YjbR family DNA-binding protein [Alphaproteobacteria bacterium]|nr:MmcQ/YjbR family DNA-binding protein [Alphaproteobacteria bacterium]